jgi:hypothetical protein
MAEADPFLENPCKTACAYGTCGGPSWGDPYGCGGCCYCMGGCRVEYELEQAYIPETQEQYQQRIRWEADQEANVDYPFPL